MEEADPYDIEFLLHQRETSPEKYVSGTNPVLRAIIDGVCDHRSILSLLNGLPDIVRQIWDQILSCWKKCIKDRRTYSKRKEGYKIPLYVKHVPGFFMFPEPKDININMMPFVMETTFEKCRLPSYLKPYWERILSQRSCFGGKSVIPQGEIGKIGYLTIHESYVQEKTCQRRPGLHTDCPGKLMIIPDEMGHCICIGRVTEEEKDMICERISRTGSGFAREKIMDYSQITELVGGIYMASNISNSCAAWNCQIEADEEGEEIIGHLGDVEHLRDQLPGEPVRMEGNLVYWITDRTPYESLPLEVGAYRQYFRLVTSHVSFWFEEHSTKNPCGVLPDPVITKIIKGSKLVDDLALLLYMTPRVETAEE